MNREFILDFMKEDNYPEEAVAEFDRVIGVLKDKGKEPLMDRLREKYIASEDKGLGYYVEQMDALAEETNISTYTLQEVFIVSCMDELHDRYAAAGIEDEIYRQGAADLTAKLLECKEVKGVWGTFVCTWNGGMFSMNRFALGRFQYEKSDWPYERYEKNGIVIEKGEPLYYIHIPSLPVPLTDEVRYDSYRKAYDFLIRRRGLSGPLKCRCCSWLMYKEMQNFLPPTSNILKFQRDFDIVYSNDTEKFGDAWRVFGHWADGDVKDYPQDTSLRKAYAQRLLSGKPAGNGTGVLIFDGEKLLNNDWD